MTLNSIIGLSDTNGELIQIELTPFLALDLSDTNKKQQVLNYFRNNYTFFINCLKRYVYPDDKIYSSLITTLDPSNIYKYFFESLKIDRIVIVEKKNTVIGFFTIKTLSDINTEIKYYESPNVCRLAIINLIEASVFYTNESLNEEFITFNNISFISIHYILQHKLNVLLKDITTITTPEGITSVTATMNSFKQVNSDTISTINKYKKV